MGDLRLHKRRDKDRPLTWEEVDQNWDMIEECINRLQNGGEEPPPPPPPPLIIVNPGEVTLTVSGIPAATVEVESNVLWEVLGLISGVIEWNDGSHDRLYVNNATGEIGTTVVSINSVANNTGRDRDMFVEFYGLLEKTRGKVLVRQRRM